MPVGDILSVSLMLFGERVAIRRFRQSQFSDYRQNLAISSDADLTAIAGIWRFRRKFKFLNLIAASFPLLFTSLASYNMDDIILFEEDVPAITNSPKNKVRTSALADVTNVFNNRYV